MPFTGRVSTARMASGFSLVEMAIVLVVIALILGAVLQGQALIDNARYKSFRRALHADRTAFNTFRERYHALPGDFAQASGRLDGGQTDGNGNGLIEHDGTRRCDSAGEEACTAWRHLRAAGLLKGDPALTGAGASPVDAYGTRGSSFYSGQGKQDEFGPKLLVTGIPVAIAARLDRDEDDGHCDSGRVTGSTCNGQDWPDQGMVDVVYGL